MPSPTPTPRPRPTDDDEDSFNAVASKLSPETQRRLFMPRQPDATPTPTPTATPYQETPSNWREGQEYMKKRENMPSGTSVGDAIKRFFRII